MKKLILLTAFIFMLTSHGYCITQNQQTIGKIEESLYGFQYSDESMASRLDRVEQSVYGKTFTKSENERISKLAKDVSANSIGQEIPPVEDTFAEDSDYIAEEMEETSDVSYPAIDEMEKQIFKEVNKKDKIKDRLAKLEQKALNKTYNDDDLSTRVDRLKAEIRPKSLMENNMAQTYNTFYDGDIPKSDTNYHLDKYVPPGSFDYEYYNDKNNRLGDYYDNGYSSYSSSPYSSKKYSDKPKKVSLTTIEKKLFKQNYNNDTTEKRLSRIENAMFGSEFASDDTETRIERISSAYQAEKSAGRYDSNKFSQNMATAVQIGTLILMVLACIL